MTRPGERRQHDRHRLPVRMTVAHLGILPALAVLGSATMSPAAADDPTSAVTTAYTINDPRIAESSGLARDADSKVFWTANDSGDSGVAYAVDPAGRTRGTLEFDADPIDIEALAYDEGTLYLADIGDNGRRRDSVQIYAFSNPRPNQDRGDNYVVYDFVYPDGSHDAEAILVTKGRIYIVTKASEGVIYRAPRQLSVNSANLLTRVGAAPAYVTDASVLPSGQYALRTYLSVEVLDPQLYAPVARGALPFQRQGESMTLSLSDDALLVGSEGAAAPVLRVPIPTELAAAPPGAQTPPPSPEPSVPVDAAGEGTNRTGTFVALVLALLASIAAGLIVFFRDRGHDLQSRPESRPRRLWDIVIPDGSRNRPDDAGRPGQPGEAEEDGERTVVRRPPARGGDTGPGSGYRREIWDLPIPDDDGPTEIRRR